MLLKLNVTKETALVASSISNPLIVSSGSKSIKESFTAFLGCHFASAPRRYLLSASFLLGPGTNPLKLGPPIELTSVVNTLYKFISFSKSISFNVSVTMVVSISKVTLIVSGSNFAFKLIISHEKTWIVSFDVVGNKSLL